MRQRPDDQRRLLRIEEVGVRQVRQVLAVVATRVLPSAPDVDVAIGVEHANVLVGFVRVAIRLEIVEERPTAVVTNVASSATSNGGERACVVAHVDFDAGSCPACSSAEKSALKYFVPAPHSVNAGSATRSPD